MPDESLPLSLFNHFADLDDPRRDHGKHHKLIDMALVHAAARAHNLRNEQQPFCPLISVQGTPFRFINNHSLRAMVHHLQA